MNPLSATDEQRLKTAIYNRSDDHAHQALQWVQELARVTREVSAQGSAAHADTRTVFWIRLLGVLVEVGDFYEYTVKLADDCGAGATRLATDARVVRDAIRAVRDSMDEDERLWLHYRRDVECHVWQQSYELSRKKNGLKEKRGFALLGGKELTVDDFDQRSTALFRKHGRSEPAIAAHFAKLLVPGIEHVLDAMRRLY